jgi:hypothetical protein
METGTTVGDEETGVAITVTFAFTQLLFPQLFSARK